MTRYIDRFLRLGVIALLTAMCTSCADKTYTPPEIIVDKSSCARCAMLISDSRYAAAIKSGASYLVFDDIGCMLTYIEANHGVDDKLVWVRDYTMDTWIGAKQAQFFHAEGDVTPMGYGYIAVTSSNPPIGLTNLLQVGSVEQLRTDYVSRMKAL